MAAGVTRECLRSKRLVYVIQADKKLSYLKGRSRIAYIGTTRKGVSRVLGSLAYRAKTILRWRGVRECHVKLLTCKARRGVETWRKLERALLVVFRELYGEVPRCNRQGSRMKPRDVFKYFRHPRVRRVIEDMS
jgi:hypothetical protein